MEKTLKDLFGNHKSVPIEKKEDVSFQRKKKNIKIKDFSSEFVDKDQAISLLLLGFNEPCMAYYFSYSTKPVIKETDWDNSFDKTHAPTKTKASEFLLKLLMDKKLVLKDRVKEYIF